MNREGLLIFIFLLLLPPLQAQEAQLDQVLEFPESKLSLRKALRFLTNETAFSFAYNSKELPLGKPILLPDRSISIQVFCDYLLQTEEIEWSVIGSQIILTRELTKYFHLDGFVRDAHSGESLIGAHIYTADGKYGTTSNQEGYFNLVLEEGENEIIVSYISYESIFDSVAVYENIRKNYDLFAGYQLAPIVVVPKKIDTLLLDSAIQWERDSMVYEGYTVNFIEKSRQLPAFNGEPDLLRFTQLLPGVIASNSGNSAIDVRGGTQDQNLVLLESAQLYNYTHRNGVSLFNSSVINHAQLHKNKMPTRFAGRLSSVLDIYLKDGNRYDQDWEASIGSNALKLMTSGPFINTKTTYVASGRVSWVNLFDNLSSQITETSDESYFFHDYYGKITHHANDRDKISFSTYIGADRTKDEFNTDSTFLKNNLRQQTYLASLKWNRIINNEWFLQSNLTFSKFLINQVIENSPNIQPNVRSKFETGIEDFTLNVQLENRRFSNQRIFAGAKIIHHRFRPGRTSTSTFMNNGDNSTTEIQGNDLNSVEANIYLEDEYEINTTLKLIAGINISSLLRTDKLHGRLEPRFSFIWSPNFKSLLQLDYSQNTQYVHFLGNTGRSNFSPGLWVTSTDRVKPQSSKILSLRYHRILSDKLEIDISPYYKRYSNITRYRDRLLLQNSIDDWESFLNVFDGYSTGTEFMIQKTGKKLDLSVSYAYSVNKQQFVGTTEYFPSKNDHRHSVNFVGLFNYQSRRKKNKTKYFGAVWRYYSGGFMTVPDIVIPEENSFNYTLSYTSLNNLQLPPVHSLDISLASRKITKRGNIRYINYGLINFYNRSNSYNYRLDIIANSFNLRKELTPTDYVTFYFQYTLKF